MPPILGERPTKSGLLQFGSPSLCSRSPGMRTEIGESLWLIPRIFPFSGDGGRRLSSIMHCGRGAQATFRGLRFAPASYRGVGNMCCPAIAVAERAQRPHSQGQTPWIGLRDEPLRIRVNINHRHGAAELKLSDQLEEKCGCGLAFIY
jgi:hypothetical protein